MNYPWTWAVSVFILYYTPDLTKSSAGVYKRLEA